MLKYLRRKSYDVIELAQNHQVREAVGVRMAGWRRGGDGETRLAMSG